MSFAYCPYCSSALIDAEIEGVMRKRCSVPSCRFVHYDNPTPVVAAIVQRDHHVVLIQNKGWPAEWFGLVSGFLEYKEDPKEAIKREVKEELLVSCTIESLVGVYGFEMMNQVLMVYHVTIEDEPSLGDELAAMKSVSIDALKPWEMGTGQAVKDWLAARCNRD